MQGSGKVDYLNGKGYDHHLLRFSLLQPWQDQSMSILLWQNQVKQAISKLNPFLWSHQR
jgi:hypothetical protein